MAQLRRPSMRQVLTAAMFAALALVAGVSQTRDPDVFWHLQVGRVALSQLTTIPADVFSYSQAGAPWAHKDLVADVLLYAGFAQLGYVWLLVLKVLAVAGLAFGYGTLPGP